MEYDESIAQLFERLEPLSAPDEPSQNSSQLRAVRVFAIVAIVVLAGIVANFIVRDTPQSTATVETTSDNNEALVGGSPLAKVPTVYTPDNAVPLIFNAVTAGNDSFVKDIGVPSPQLLVTSPTSQSYVNPARDLNFASLNGATFRPGPEPGLVVWTENSLATLIAVTPDGQSIVDETPVRLGSLSSPTSVQVSPDGTIAWVVKIIGEAMRVERVETSTGTPAGAFEVDRVARIVGATNDELLLAEDTGTTDRFADEVLIQVNVDGDVTDAIQPLGSNPYFIGTSDDLVAALVEGGSEIEIYSRNGGEEARRSVPSPDGFDWTAINRVVTPSTSPAPSAWSRVNSQLVVGVRERGGQQTSGFALIDSSNIVALSIERVDDVKSAYFSWTGDLVVLRPALDAVGFLAAVEGGDEFFVPQEIYAML